MAVVVVVVVEKVGWGRRKEKTVECWCGEIKNKRARESQEAPRG